MLIIQLHCDREADAWRGGLKIYLKHQPFCRAVSIRDGRLRAEGCAEFSLLLALLAWANQHEASDLFLALRPRTD
jgi:hypothetical protein